MRPSSPARVHIILAREAPLAIVIRRGPSRSVCTMLWERKHDRFTLGQWLRGRIYERRCDLSPDGQHFLYFAMNGKLDSAMGGSWTAISRTPWLKATGLWANRTCWNGGGLFTANATYWLNAPFIGQKEQFTPPGLSRDERFPFHESYGGECPGVYYIRLQRDGWRLTSRSHDDGERLSVFEKLLPEGWLLRKTAHAGIHDLQGKGCYYDTHSLYHEQRGLTLDFPEWEWADLDNNRIVWVEKGALYAAQLSAKGLRYSSLLFDFNPMSFQKVRAPYSGPNE